MFPNNRDAIFFEKCLFIFFPQPGAFPMQVTGKDVRSEDWKIQHLTSEGIKPLNACYRDLSRVTCFPAIIQSIISPEQTGGSSKLKVTLWWARPSRVWCMCARARERWIEGLLGGAATPLLLLHHRHTHTHTRAHTHTHTRTRTHTHTRKRTHTHTWTRLELGRI